MKKKFLSMIFVLSLVFMNTTTFVKAEESSSRPSNQTCINESVIKLKYGMQKLWIEHAWWTRSVIVSKLANLEDQKDVLE